MSESATMKVEQTSQNRSFFKKTINNITNPNIKGCDARREGRTLAGLVGKLSMDSIINLYESLALKYPFHRDEFKKAFRRTL